jgi:amidase
MNDLPTLARLDGIAQAELCARGEVSRAELITASLVRIDALNPLLRAVVTTADAPTSEGAGPLAGVPFLMKDSTPWPGLRCSIGSRLFRRNVAQPQQQTPFGQRLAASGMVCVGKSATSEIGLLGSTETLLEGVTHNPWRLDRSATGSSGGAAAAVAAGIVPVAHANDAGGSIRIPAAACGLFGFKPGRGRSVSAGLGGTDYGDLAIDHAVTRSVRDSAAFLSLTEDRDANEPVGFVRDPIARPLRIGAWTRTASGEEPEPAVRRAHESAIALLVELGHTVETIDGPVVDGPALGDAFFLIAGAAVKGIVEAMDRMRGVPVQRDELEPFTWSLFDAVVARGPDAVAWSRGVLAKAASEYRAKTAGFDVVMTPTLATETWALGHLSPTYGREELIARMARSVGYTPIQNVTGDPAMSVPLSFTDGEMPIGAHFAARVGAEKVLFGLAYQLEAARPWKDRWPRYSIPTLFA